MTNNQNRNIENGAEVVIDASRSAEEKVACETANDEFKLTVRKLVMPVRPRGVLAE